MAKVKVDELIERAIVSKHDERGFEIPDPNPMEMPVNFKRPLTIQEQIRQLIRVEASAVARNSGYETFEEADDFEVGDEPEVYSPYELADEQADAKIRDFIEENPAAPKPAKQPPAGTPPQAAASDEGSGT